MKQNKENTMRIEDIAEICHNANKAYCESIGDNSQSFWSDAPDWQKESARLGVKLHTDNPDADASASHESWMTQKIADGWVYGKTKDPKEKTHHCLVSFEDLPFDQQIKDHIFRSIVHALQEMEVLRTQPKQIKG